jgi:uncharacterized protein DUF6600/FecR-like protein
MGGAMRRLGILTVVALTLPPAAFAQSYRHARVRHVEEGVSIQRATETGSEEATVNLPFLPGDRVWTDAGGRVEFLFADGSQVRLDRRSKLDYQSVDGAEDGTIVLRLWSGSAYVRQNPRGRAARFAIETPNGTADLREGGTYRLDVTGAETRVSVYEGEATVDAGEQIRVRAGERASARRGSRPWGPDRFDRAEDDAFARWNDDLGQDEEWASGRPEDLPDEVSPYADDFARNGSWFFEAGVGNVWRPNVSIGWEPYVHGRWAWTAYGWTWVPNETWGWAPYHYGRWDRSAALGWYWVPGRTWGPAWVDWSVSGTHVGWRPLGYRDRHDGRRGTAVSRGSARDGWTYVRRGDLGARDVAQRRVPTGTVGGPEMRVVEGTRGRLGRDLSVADGQQAVPRNIRTRPGPGDTVEELRSDPMTTIPFPVARRKYESAREREREQQNNPSVGPRGRQNGSGVRPEASPDTSTWERRSARERGDAPADDAGARARPRSDDGDREALRPWFRSLSRPRAEGEAQARPVRDREQEREAEPARDQSRRRPERVSPPPPPSGGDRGGSRGGEGRERSGGQSRGGDGRERSGGQSRGGGNDRGGGAVRRDHH